MLCWLHEKPFSEFDASWGKESPSSGAGGRNSRGLGRDKDRRLAFVLRGSASRMDNGSPGSNADEFEPLDPRGERRRTGEFATEAEAWQAQRLGDQGAEDHCSASGEVAAGLRAKSSAVGWADIGDPLKATLWDNLKGKAGAEVDASPGLSIEAGWLCLSTGES